MPTKTRQPVYLPSLLVVFLDGNAHRDRKDPVGENGHLVGLAVAVGVFEDLDLVGVVNPVKPRVAATGEPVVQTLGDPDPAAGIDVDVRRVHDHGLGRPESGHQARGRFELRSDSQGADLRFRRYGYHPETDAETQELARRHGWDVIC